MRIVAICFMTHAAILRRIPILRSIPIFLMTLAASLMPALAVHAAGNEIVVGQIFDQSPAWIEAGRDYAAGAKTYFDLINSEGGINGRRIVYLTKDANGSAAEVKRAAAELIDGSKADVLFGPVGDATIRALLEPGSAQPEGVAIFAPLTGVAQSRASVQFLRAGYDDEARELVRHFIGLGLGSFCLVFTENEDHQAAIRAVRDAIAAQGAKLTCEARIDAGAGNAKSAADRSARARPQAVIVVGDTAVVGNFAREFPFKQLGVLMGGLSLVNHTALMEIAGPQTAKGIVLTQVVPSPLRAGVPVVREHVKAMKTFRDEPPSHLTLEGFIAAKALVEALRAGLPSRPLRREDIFAILSRSQQSIAATLAALDTGMTHTRTGKPVDITMVRGDGTLIR